MTTMEGKKKTARVNMSSASAAAAAATTHAVLLTRAHQHQHRSLPFTHQKNSDACASINGNSRLSIWRTHTRPKQHTTEEKKTKENKKGKKTRQRNDLRSSAFSLVPLLLLLLLPLDFRQRNTDTHTRAHTHTYKSRYFLLSEEKKIRDDAIKLAAHKELPHQLVHL